MTVQEHIDNILSASGEEVVKRWTAALQDRPMDSKKILNAVSEHLVEHSLGLY